MMLYFEASCERMFRCCTYKLSSLSPQVVSKEGKLGASKGGTLTGQGETGLVYMTVGGEIRSRALNHVESFCMGQLRVGDEADEGLMEIAQAVKRHVLMPPPSRQLPIFIPVPLRAASLTLTISPRPVTADATT